MKAVPAEVDLPTPPRRRLLTVALIIMWGGPLLCLIGLVALASGLTDTHTVSGTEPTPLGLQPDRTYVVLSGQTDPLQCQVELEDQPALDVRPTTVSILT
ncbi:MAG: hypothetical protein LBL92_03055, partial [Propionibacteriaceae bacterium]|nr:hypothetical protein [Propionibacteriaceae bacterium]